MLSGKQYTWNKYYTFARYIEATGYRYTNIDAPLLHNYLWFCMIWNLYCYIYSAILFYVKYMDDLFFSFWKGDCNDLSPTTYIEQQNLYFLWELDLDRDIQTILSIYCIIINRNKMHKYCLNILYLLDNIHGRLTISLSPPPSVDLGTKPWPRTTATAQSGSWSCALQ